MRRTHNVAPVHSGVEGHFDHPHDRSWMYIADTVHPILAELVGESDAGVSQAQAHIT